VFKLVLLNELLSKILLNRLLSKILLNELLSDNYHYHVFDRFSSWISKILWIHLV